MSEGRRAKDEPEPAPAPDADEDADASAIVARGALHA